MLIRKMCGMKICVLEEKLIKLDIRLEFDVNRESGNRKQERKGEYAKSK